MLLLHPAPHTQSYYPPKHLPPCTLKHILIVVQVISEELNSTVSALLVQLLQWQERKRDELITKGARRADGEAQLRASSKRVVAGLRCASILVCIGVNLFSTIQSQIGLTRKLSCTALFQERINVT